uniref:C2H2-type domain-containing protein n=1 Tax=Culex tarsalis TaxID=7177 RepID=A0A1Q3EWF0_CULTA
MYPKHYQKCCRLCLGTSKKQLEISAVPELPQMLWMLYKLEIKPSDKCSTRICIDCYYEAKVFCNWLRVHRKLEQQIVTNAAIFEEELNRQEAVPVQKVEIICKICRTTWKTMKLLKKHLIKHHQIPRVLLKSAQRVLVATEKEPVKCEICSAVFAEAKALFLHKTTVHKTCLIQSKPVLDRQPVRRMFRSRSTRAMEDYPVVEPEPSVRITRRSKSVSGPVDLLGPSQPPALRTRSKSQDLEKLLAEAVISTSAKKKEKSTKNEKHWHHSAVDSTPQKEVVELAAEPLRKSDSIRGQPRMRSLSTNKKEDKRQLRKRALSTVGL